MAVVFLSDALIILDRAEHGSARFTERLQGACCLCPIDLFNAFKSKHHIAIHNDNVTVHGHCFQAEAIDQIAQGIGPGGGIAIYFGNAGLVERTTFLK